MAVLLPPEIATHVAHPVARLFRSRLGLWTVGGISFVESALLVPIITDPFMVAYIVLNRARTFVAVIVTTATSVLGGLAAYFMARFFSDLVMPWLGPETLTYFEQLAVQIQNEIFVLTILGAVTPIPFTLVCLAAGFVSGNVWVFIIASILGRGFRYGVVGYLTYRFGAQATAHIKRNVRFATVGTIVLVGLYIAYKFF